MEKYLNIAGVKEESMANGPGLRYVIFVQGCPHHCEGCHNEHTWEFKDNRLMTVDELFEEIKKNYPIIKHGGVTFSGGEPMCQDTLLTQLAIKLKEEFGKEFNIWCYTGYRYEDLNSPLLKCVDTLIDGVFMKDKMEGALRFTGSSNQRVLNLKDGKII